MKNNVLHIKCARIKEDIEHYRSTGIIPKALRMGEYTLTDMIKCYPEFDTDTTRVAEILNKNYSRLQRAALTDLKSKLRAEYANVITNLETNNPDFMFPTILGQYRPDINPVRALYYEIREMTRDFNPKNARHLWLMSIIQEHEFNDRVLKALSTDVANLKQIVEKYDNPLLLLDNSIPLELFHAKQEIKDFKHYYNVLKIARDWVPR